MALGAVLAAALTDHSARRFALWLGGVDVLLQPTTGGNRYGAPIESVRVSEASPPGVSTMSFRCEDPLGLVPLPGPGTEVILQDLTHDWPAFRGYVSTADVSPHDDGFGRDIVIDCDGTEIDLDWTLAKRDLVAGEDLVAVWEQLASSIPNLTIAQSSGIDNGAGIAVGFVGYTVASAGSPGRGTTRQLILDAWNRRTPVAGDVPVVSFIDFHRVLRITRNDSLPSFWTGLAVSTAGPIRAADLHYSLEPGDYIERVWVQGSAGTEYGPFSLGTGIHGRTVSISDSSVTDAATAQNVGIAYLQQNAATIALRGSCRIETFDPGAGEIHPRAGITITDASVGLAGVTFVISDIDRTYIAGGTLETWRVAFGGRVPSSMRLLRHLTRSQLS